MAELKMVRYLQEEEKQILFLLDKFHEQLSKLKVEELNIKSAIREKQFQEMTGAANQEPGPSGVVRDVDLATVNAERIDLSVREELNLFARTSFNNRAREEEEEEEEDDDDDDS